MTAALQPDTPKDLIKQLIVADISPLRGSLSPEFRRYIDALLEIEKEGKVKSRKEAFEALGRVEKVRKCCVSRFSCIHLIRNVQDPLIRQFLLTNLAPSASNEPLKFRIPLEYIKQNIDGLGDFPYSPGERKWEGPALFIRGEKSKCVLFYIFSFFIFL